MISEELKPQFEVKLVKKRNSHFYTALGQTLPGTTGITDIIGGNKTRALCGWSVKKALEVVRGWLLSYGANPVLLEPDLVEQKLEEARKEPARRKDTAADKGTLFHGYIEQWIKTGTLNPDPEFADILKQLIVELSTRGITLVAAEVPVASPSYGFGGLVDAIGLLNDEPGVVDWKFSNGIRDDYYLQVGGAYVQAATETFGSIFRWAFIFRYDFEGNFWEVRELTDLTRAIEGFLAAKKLQEVLKEYAKEQGTR